MAILNVLGSSLGFLRTGLKLVIKGVPAGVTGADARSKERYRRVGLSALASASARLIGMATAFVTIPVAVRYLGNEQYGLWATISSIIGLMAFADLGLSNGLVNATSEAYGSNDHKAMRRYSSTAFFLLLGIALLLAGLLALAYGSIPWRELFNVASQDAATVAGPAAAVFAAFFLAGLPLGVVQRLRMGLQEGFVSSLWQAVGSVVGLVGVLAAVLAEASLPWLVAATSLGTIIALTLDGLSLVRSRHPWLRPRLADFDPAAATKVLRLGMLFFIFNIAIVVGYQTDNVVIAQMLGADQVTLYAVPMRLFLIVPTFLGFVLTPLWPMYREALVRGDVPWVRRALGRSLSLAIITSLPIAVVLVVFGVPLVHWWAGESVSPPVPLLLGLALWSVLSSVGGALGMFLNGAGVLRLQALCASVMVVVNIALSVVLTGLFGVSGPVWGSAISVGLVILLPLGLYTHRVLLPNLIGSADPTREHPLNLSIMKDPDA